MLKTFFTTASCKRNQKICMFATQFRFMKDCGNTSSILLAAMHPYKRHYNSDLSIWLSVDPMSDKYPGVSPYAYCANNPVVLWDIDGRWIPGLDDDGNVTYTAEKGDNYKTFALQFSCRGKENEIFKNAGYGIGDKDVKAGDVIKGSAVQKATGSDVLKGKWNNMTNNQKASQIMFALMDGERKHSEINGAYAIDLNDYIIGFSTRSDGLNLYNVTIPIKGGGTRIANMSIASVSMIRDEESRLLVNYRGKDCGEGYNTTKYSCAKNPKAEDPFTAIMVR